MKLKNSGYVPLMETCKQGECSIRMIAIPMNEKFIMEYCKSGMVLEPITEAYIMRKCSEKMMMMVNNPSTMLNQVINYGNLQKELMSIWMEERMAMPQMVASPNLNFKAKQIGNLGQKGYF